ncbi:hypothetical protein E7T09_04305 [Deinococcus sp. KSM4-11]|uniref:hypothetical protein n=1 Tax=Deinococcus sp. KSM4-11 TaxID=2568654 RepID=UPI0010A2B2A6|nr:hypothetical protein [Deinococcus sp. KSM4-11]THF88436.1 hypothetical protein E7T09_04305 [Deinococcus sp. KSM4-11]
MTTPPPIDAWVLEADTDLVTSHYDDTTQIVRTWATQHGLPDGASFNVQYSGRTTSGAFDAFSVTGEATADQVEQLASRLNRAYDTQIVVRRTRLISVPHVGMTDGLPTGKYSYVDPVIMERARQPEGDERDLN